MFYNRPMDAELINTGEAYGGAVDQRVHGARRLDREGKLLAQRRTRSAECALDQAGQLRELRKQTPLESNPLALRGERNREVR